MSTEYTAERWARQPVRPTHPARIPKFRFDPANALRRISIKFDTSGKSLAK
jgi:hypothetical protein